MLRRLSLWGLPLIATAGLVWLMPSRAPSAQTEPLAVAERPDGTAEAYYALGDAALTTGFTLITDYWTTLIEESPHLARGHVDHYLPTELKTLNYRPADAMMADLAEIFFADRHPRTGLIPYAYAADLPPDPTPTGGATTTDQQQPVGLIERAAELCAWFPDQRPLQAQCLALAEATVIAFDVPDTSSAPDTSGTPGPANTSTPAPSPTGLWGWVNIAGGHPRHSVTLTQDYGQVALGMAQIAEAQRRPDLLQWADQKLQFVWQHPQSATLPLLYEQFVLTQGRDRPEERSSDTDTLYFVRQLFALCEMTNQPQYCAQALATTDVWVEGAWVPEWGHFVRKLDPDGRPAVDSLYGDGKYNTLAMLVEAYRVTGDQRYLNRLQTAWDTLLRLGENGLVPEMVQRGAVVTDQGLDPQQTIFLEILLEAHAVSNDPAFLAAANTLGNAILNQGASALRLESGQGGDALLQLALARQPIGRLEVHLPAAATQITLRRDSETLLQTHVPAPVAVFYLPEDTYDLTVAGETQRITLQGQQIQHFPIP